MRLILSSLLTLFLLNGLAAQNLEITEIRRLYRETQENKGSYTRQTQHDFEHSSEGGQLTAYRDEREIRLIETVYYGHMGNSASEYYFANGQLYFVFVKTRHYNAPPTVSEHDESKTTTEEYRYYFWEGQMIRCIQPDGSFLEADSDEFAEQAERIAELAEMALEEFQ